MIKLKDVSKYYRTANSVGLGLRKINLEFVKGEFVVITGESGSGKSTLLNVISGLDSYQEGEMYLFGEETSHFSVDEWERYRALNIGFVSQNYNIIESYTVLQNVLVSLELQDYPKQNRRNRAVELIKLVGLEKRIHHKAGKLSGGEKQRTVIARALAKDAPVIVCDEPTGNLDSESGKSIIALIRMLSKDKLIFFVTHNYEEVAHAATRRVRMRDGEVIEDQEIKKYEVMEDFKKNITARKIPFLTLLNSSLRTLFATPKKLIFMLTLQTIITGIFIFIYSYLMLSGDLLIGELASDNDSSHQIEMVKRDESKITDLSDFEDNELIRSIVEYETIYFTYQAIGKIEGDDPAGSYPLGRINMNDATVLNLGDLVEGELPGEGEVVLSALSMELYDLEVGDEVLLLRVYTELTKSIGDTYTISGIALRGNDKSVYFNSDVFSDRELALDGLITISGKAINYRFNDLDPFNEYPNPEEKFDLLRSGKLVFDDSLPDWGIVIPENLWPDVTMLDFDLEIGSYYGKSYIFEHISKDSVRKGSETTNNIYVSSKYQDILLHYYFGDDFEPSKIILNVHDITDGKELADSLDQNIYRVYYDVVALDSRDAMMTQSQFVVVSYIIVFIVGSLLYTILGVVLRNINKAKRRDFTILRSIGANRSFLARQVVLEQVIGGVIAYIFVVITFMILCRYNYRIAETMKHVHFSQYLILFIISIFFSIQVSLRFNKRIFNFSVVSSLNESEEAK